MSGLRVFVVSVHGDGFLIEHEDGVRRGGSWTTRVVDAVDEAAAELAAVEAVRSDERLLAVVRNEPEDSPMLYAMEIFEIEYPTAWVTFNRAAAGEEEEAT